nr:DUF3265 domain-containing protein [Vibrio splendidus]
MIRNAWHFYDAMRFVFKVVYGGFVWCCSHANLALAF